LGGISKTEPRASVIKFDEVLKYDLSQGKWNVMPPLPRGVVDLQSLTSLAIEDHILLFTGQRNVWQLDLRTQQYAETTPMPQAVAVDQFFWLHQQIVGAGGESEIEGPRRRSQWTFTARLVAASASP